MQRLDVRLLGEPEFRVANETLRLKLLPRCFAVLGYIVAHRKQKLSRTSMAMALWPDELEQEARTNLRRHLHILTAALRGASLRLPITADQHHISWSESDGVVVDTVAFETHCAAGRALDAIAAYGGDFLAGTYDDWALDVRELLRTKYQNALLDAAETELLRRDFARAVEHADAALHEDPWREDALRLKLTALYKLGERNAALAAYERFASRLRDEMGVAPMPETNAVKEAIVSNIPLGALDERQTVVENSLRLVLPFIGRAREIERLRSLWNRAAHGRGATCFITGEAGIGKSRLAQEFARLVDREGGLTLVGNTSQPEAAPYQALAAALRNVLSHIQDLDVDDVWQASLAELIPELRAVKPDLPILAPLSPERSQQRLIEAICRILGELSRTRPLFVVIEDAQWAEDATLRLLRELANRAGALPILIAATIRTEAAMPSIEALRHALQREQRATSMALDPIARESFDDIMRANSPFASIAAEKIGEIAELSQGQPLFASMMFQAHLSSASESQDAVAAGTLTGAVDLRLAALAPATRVIAEAAAVAGSSFSTDFLAKIGGWSEAEVFRAVDALLDGSIIREAGHADIEYRFSHALIERSLYESLRPEIREARHRRIATILDDAGSNERTAHVARHWKRANQPAAAHDAFLRAIAFALSLYAWADSRALAREARETCADDRQRFNLLELAAPAASITGSAPDLSAHVEEMLRIARVSGSAEMLVAALVSHARLARHAGNRVAQIESAEELETIAASIGSRQFARAAAIVRGYTTGYDGDYRASLTHFEHALSLLGNGDDPLLELEIRERSIVALLALSRYDDAEVQLNAAKTNRDGSLQQHIRIAFAECNIAMARYDYERLGRTAAELLVHAERAGDLGALTAAHIYIAESNHLSPTTAREHWARAAEVSPGMIASNYAHLNRGFYELAYGRFDLAEQYSAMAREGARTAGVRFLETNALVHLAHAALGSGDVPLSRSYVAQARALGLEELHQGLAAQIALADGVTQFAAGDRDAGLRALRLACERYRDAGITGGLLNAEALLLEYLLEIETNAGDLGETVAHIKAMLSEQLISASWRPTQIYAALARAGDDECRAHGKHLVETILARIADEETKNAFRALAHNRYLLSRR